LNALPITPELNSFCLRSFSKYVYVYHNTGHIKNFNKKTDWPVSFINIKNFFARYPKEFPDKYFSTYDK